MKLLFLLGVLFLSIGTTKAVAKTNIEAYWLGIVFGSGGTICELVRTGKIGSEYAAEFMSDSMETLASDPEMSDYYATIKEGYQGLINDQACKGILY